MQRLANRGHLFERIRLPRFAFWDSAQSHFLSDPTEATCGYQEDGRESSAVHWLATYASTLYRSHPRNTPLTGTMQLRLFATGKGGSFVCDTSLTEAIHVYLTPIPLILRYAHR